MNNMNNNNNDNINNYNNNNYNNNKFKILICFNQNVLVIDEQGSAGIIIVFCLL